MATYLVLDVDLAAVRNDDWHACREFCDPVKKKTEIAGYRLRFCKVRRLGNGAIASTALANPRLSPPSHHRTNAPPASH